MKLVNKSSISRTNTLDNLFSRDHESPSYAWYLQNMICLYILHSLSKTCVIFQIIQVFLGHLKMFIKVI